jgi:hypothetical protein
LCWLKAVETPQFFAASGSNLGVFVFRPKRYWSDTTRGLNRTSRIGCDRDESKASSARVGLNRLQQIGLGLFDFVVDEYARGLAGGFGKSQT